MGPQDRNPRRSGNPNDSRITHPRTPYDWIAKRHSPRTSSLLVKTIFFWILLAIVVAVMLNHCRPSRGTTPSQSFSSAQETPENPANSPAAAIPLITGGQAQPVAPMESTPATTARAEPDEGEKELEGEQPRTATSVKITLTRDKTGNLCWPGHDQSEKRHAVGRYRCQRRGGAGKNRQENWPEKRQAHAVSDRRRPRHKLCDHLG